MGVETLITATTILCFSFIPWVAVLGYKFYNSPTTGEGLVKIADVIKEKTRKQIESDEKIAEMNLEASQNNLRAAQVRQTL